MAHDGNRIYSEIKNGVKHGIDVTADVGAVLGVASNDIGYMCSNRHGKINMLSIFKPTRKHGIMPSNPQTGPNDTSNGDSSVEASEWFDGISRYGVRKPYIRIPVSQLQSSAPAFGPGGAPALVNVGLSDIAIESAAYSDGNMTTVAKYWSYDAPQTGGFFRLTDFDNYRNNVVQYNETHDTSPIRALGFSVGITGNTAAFGAAQIYIQRADSVGDDGVSGNLGLNALFDTASTSRPLYAGIAITSLRGATGITPQTRTPLTQIQIMGQPLSNTGGDTSTGVVTMRALSLSSMASAGPAASSTTFATDEYVAIVPFLCRLNTAGDQWIIFGINAPGHRNYAVDKISNIVSTGMRVKVRNVSLAFTLVRNKTTGTYRFYLANDSALSISFMASGEGRFASVRNLEPGLSGPASQYMTVTAVQSGSFSVKTDPDVSGARIVTAQTSTKTGAGMLSGWSATSPRTSGMYIEVKPRADMTADSFMIGVSFGYWYESWHTMNGAFSVSIADDTGKTYSCTVL
jgi:hypothetical protein|nr:MAG TPA: hypothetical protein [Caudoviricetes sp.]